MNDALFLTEAEGVQLYRGLAKLTDPEWRRKVELVRFILSGGFRIGEIPQLRIPEDCALTGIVTVRRTKTGVSRRVMIAPEGRPFYIQWILEQGEGPLFRANVPHEVRPAQVRTLRRWWSEVLEACGVRHVNPHAGRHTYATWERASRRLDLKEIQAQLGHASIKTTLEYYEHSDVETRYREDKAPAFWDEALSDGAAPNVIPFKKRSA